MAPFPVILRRLGLCTLICLVSAAPSFLCAMRQFDERAMAVGVALFILAYTAVASTAAFERFHNLPFVRRTLYIGYGLRLAASLFYPVGIAADLFPGVISIEFVENVLGLKGKGFGATLAITVVQGTLLNVILAVLMSLVYGVQRLTLKPPAESAPRGFEVVVAAATQVNPAARSRPG